MIEMGSDEVGLILLFEKQILDYNLICLLRNTRKIQTKEIDVYLTTPWKSNVIMPLASSKN